MSRASLLPIILLFIVVASACNKNDDAQPSPPPANNTLSYGDSILYDPGQSSDFVAKPTETRSGTYSGFPEGIVIDAKTGAINVTKSDAGLKYKISFVATGATDTISTNVIISGINYLDGFYNLAAGDSVLKPLYNARASNALPGLNNGSLFDIGNNCNNLGCTVNTINGQINLSQTVRNGVFGKKPANNDRHEFDLSYQVNDKSNKALKTIKVKLYYFDTMGDVTPEIYDIIKSREGTILRTVASAAQTQKIERPRPPCVFIISH